MRKLVWAAIGFASAAFLAEYLLPTQGLPYIAAALAVCSAAFLPWKRGRRQAMTLVLAAAAGLLYWWGWYELRAAPCEALAGQTVTVEARVTDWPLVREDYTRLSVTVTDGAPQEPAYIYVYHADIPELAPGDTIACGLRVRSAMHRGGERAHTATSAGRFMIGYSDGDITVTGRSSQVWVYFPQRIARYVGETCRTLFPDRTGVFMKALLTGDKEDLYADTALYGDMRAAGVLHAVAVSGMHVFVLVAFLQLVFGRGRRTTLLCLPVMVVFVLMSGAGPSVVRAALMQTVYMGAPLVKRESDSPSGLSAALLLLLLMNPMSVGGIGLQLSFSCMTGYAVLMPRLTEVLRRYRRIRRSRVLHFLLLNLASTVSATAFSIPVAAYYFGAVPLLSMAANLLALPVIEILFAGGYVICAVYALVPALAGWAAWLLAWGVRWCLLVFRCIASLAFACVYTADPAVVIWLVFSYVLLLVWLGLRRRIRAAIPVSLILIALALVLLRQEGISFFGRSELAVLDVGQGECVVLLDGDAVVMADCGGSGDFGGNAGDTAADWLHSRGKRHVDLLVLSHLDDDHMSGVETLLYRLPVGGIVLPAASDAEEAAALRALAARYGVPVTDLSEPTAAGVGDLALTMLPLHAGSDDNDRGIVVLARASGTSALIMGDAGTASETALLEDGLVPDVDILVAGHHGSAGSSSALFLRAARAETAVVSVGAGNAYGLPAEEAMERLAAYCGRVLRTDEEGTVVLPLREAEEPW